MNDFAYRMLFGSFSFVWNFVVFDSSRKVTEKLKLNNFCNLNSGFNSQGTAYSSDIDKLLVIEYNFQ